MDAKQQKQVSNHRFSPGYLKPYLDTFINELSKSGYHELTTLNYYNSVAHFATWLQTKHIQLEHINNKVISNFAKHQCHCSNSYSANKVSHQYVGRVRRFIRYLCQQGIITLKESTHETPPQYLSKFKEFLQARGLATHTIEHYEYSTYMLLQLLGDKPEKYNAARIRQVICDVAKKNSRCMTKKATTALRAYLRFLSIENLCRPDLDLAVPSVAEWRLSSLPKYITDNELERVVDSCSTNSQQGVRDRAIIGGSQDTCANGSLHF